MYTEVDSANSRACKDKVGKPGRIGNEGRFRPGNKPGRSFGWICRCLVREGYDRGFVIASAGQESEIGCNETNNERKGLSRVGWKLWGGYRAKVSKIPANASEVGCLRSELESPAGFAGSGSARL